MGRPAPLPDETAPASAAHNHLFALRGHDALLGRLQALERTPLATFLRHVATTVPFFEGVVSPRRTSVRGVAPASRSLVRGERTRFLSSRFLEDAEHLIARTNGTLGPSLPVSFDAAGFYDFNYFALYRIMASRAGLLETLMRGEVGLVLVSDDPRHKRYTVRLPLCGDAQMRRLPLGRGEDEDSAVVRYLRERRVPILHGKPHTLLDLARLDERLGGRRLRPRALITAGECLYASDRARLIEWYGCEPIDAYISSEGGLIALGCPAGRCLHVLDDRVHAEVLRDDGTMASSGRGELVFTNMMNWGQAFVRYRQSDRVSLAHHCVCGYRGPTLTALVGREAEWFDMPGGIRIHTHRLAEMLDQPEVQQFEVRQDANRHLIVRWIPSPGRDAGATARTLTERLHSIAIGAFDLRQVNRITPPAGKQRRFIPQDPSAC